MTSKWIETTGDKENPTRPIDVETLGDGKFRVTIDDKSYEVSAALTDRGVFMLRDDRSVDVDIEKKDRTYRVAFPTGRAEYTLVDERIHRMESVLGGGAGASKPQIVSPMAGKVVLVSCAVGDEVKAGQTLLIIEAMKMENEIKAAHDVVIKAIGVAAGDIIDPGKLLVEFEVEAEE